MSHIDFTKTGFATKAIHAGAYDDQQYGALATPIFQTSTYTFDSVEEGGDVFAGKTNKYAYCRHGNPTVKSLEIKLAALEGAEAAVATGSGMGAISSCLIGLLKAGDHVVASDCVYGCTDVVMRQILPTLGIETSRVNTTDLAAVEAAIKPNTKMVYFETVANPVMRVTDIEAIAEIAHKHNCIVVVDNTFTPPPICTPLKHGADFVVHSMTKYLNGHGDVVAGCICGPQADIKTITSRAVGKMTGSELTPFAAYLVIRGLKTLDLRVKQHSENAKKVAEFLEKQPYIKAVYNPCLASNAEDKARADKQFEGGLTTGMVTFETKEYKGMSDFEVAKKLVNGLTIPGIGVSLGDADSLIQHPASMTHANVPEEGQIAAGITKGMIRFSVGLECAEDLIADLEQSAANL